MPRYSAIMKFKKNDGTSSNMTVNDTRNPQIATDTGLISSFMNNIVDYSLVYTAYDNDVTLRTQEDTIVNVND